MCRLLCLSLFIGCAAPDRPAGEPSTSPCAEARRLLEPDEFSPWGTSPAAVRTRLGGSADLLAEEDRVVPVSLGWIGGPEWLVFATLQPDAAPVPLGLCDDGIEISARISIDLAQERVEIPGRLRAIGPMPEVVGAFAGRVSAADVPSLELVEGELAVFGWWQATQGGVDVDVELRELAAGAPLFEAGTVVLELQGERR